jgi:hypothetical protein
VFGRDRIETVASVKKIRNRVVFIASFVKRRNDESRFGIRLHREA